MGRDERRLKDVAQEACGSLDGLRTRELEIDDKYVSLDASADGVVDFVGSRRTEGEHPSGGVSSVEGGQHLGFVDCGGWFSGHLEGAGGATRETVFSVKSFGREPYRTVVMVEVEEDRYTRWKRR